RRVQGFFHNIKAYFLNTALFRPLNILILLHQEVPPVCGTTADPAGFSPTADTAGAGCAETTRTALSVVTLSTSCKPEYPRLEPIPPELLPLI
ncbi:hypothetical protein ACPB4A_26025, partial [Escherichia coli]